MPSPEDVSQDEIKKAIMVFLKKNENPTVKTVRRDVSTQLGMEPKALDCRKAEIKELTLMCIQEMDEAADSTGVDPKEQQDHSKDAQTDSADLRANDNEEDKREEVKNHKKPESRQKRKRNEDKSIRAQKRKKKKEKEADSFVVDGDDVEDEVGVEEHEMGDDGSEDNVTWASDDQGASPTKTKKKSFSKKKPFDQLAKLKKLARMTGHGNPRLYTVLKSMGKAKQIRHIKNIFDDNDVDYSDLSRSGISKVAQEVRLRREVAELGNAIITNESGTRTRRTRKKVNYNLAEMSRIEDQSDNSGQSINEVEGEEYNAISEHEDDGSEYAPSDD